MSLSYVVIIRTILGIIFFVLGVFTARTFFADFAIFDNPYLSQTLVALVFGVFGVFAVPFLAEQVRNWFESLIQTTVAKTLADWTKQFSKQAVKTVEFRRKGPTLNKVQPSSNAATEVILDTSAVIDGRILDIAQLGFVDGSFVVPRVVLDELQRLADSGNDLKRARGRRGLDILEEIKSDSDLNLEISDFTPSERRELRGENVDKQLIELAKKRGARIASVDFNLLKTASVSGVKILNVNALAKRLRMVVLPGEALEIEIREKGKEPGQGVGYLEDGTMVVVEDGGELIGKTSLVKVTRALQTEAGRMIFAKT